MSDRITLKRIEETAAALEKCGMKTLDDLRLCLSRDVKEGIDLVSTSSNVPPALLLALLIAEAGDNAGRNGKRKLARYWRSLKTFPAIVSLSVIEIKELWVSNGLGGLLKGRKALWAVVRQSAVRPKRLWHNRRTHWPDLFAVVVIALLAVGAIVRLGSTPKQSDQYVAIKQNANLPAFHKLGDDVEIKSAPGSKGSFTSFEQVRGRYILTPLAAGSILQSTQLLSDDLSKKLGKPGKILSVPLKAGAYNTMLSVPSEVMMVLSQRTPDLKSLTPQSFAVILLSIETTGDAKSATVVVPEDKFESVAALLGSHDAFLVQTLP